VGVAGGAPPALGMPGGVVESWRVKPRVRKPTKGFRGRDGGRFGDAAC